MLAAAAADLLTVVAAQPGGKLRTQPGWERFLQAHPQHKACRALKPVCAASGGRLTYVGGGVPTKTVPHYVQLVTPSGLPGIPPPPPPPITSTEAMSYAQAAVATLSAGGPDDATPYQLDQSG